MNLFFGSLLVDFIKTAAQEHHRACLQIGWIYLLGPAALLAFVGIAVAIAAISR